MTKRVYISHTSDLKDLATAVKDAVNGIGLQGILFDDHMKKSAGPIMTSMYDLIKSCDFFIGIYAEKYGTCPPKDHCGQPTTQTYSYIHWEYQWAVEFNLDIIPLIMRYEEPRASQRKPALLDFLDQLLNKHSCGFYDDSESSIQRIAIEQVAGHLVPPENSIIVQPYFPFSKDANYRCDIFMIMPFRDYLTQIYKEDIEDIAGKLGKTIKRGDEFHAPKGEIVEQVWQAIYASQVVIVDCTIPEGEDTNGNIYYELGIADVLGKPVILITQTAPENLPFDIRHRRMITYNMTTAGRDHLRMELKEALEILFS